jgi:phosphoribosylaminoimidazole-succinocarboxamide synthase
MVYKLVVLGSGEGTNLEAIYNFTKHNPDYQVIYIISDRLNSGVLEKADRWDIQNYYLPYLSKQIRREEYDQKLANLINKVDHDLVILAGWMHILGKQFLDRMDKPVINLHPALPGEFPGKDAIGQAYKAFQQGKVSRTGIMVHHVVEEIDAGATILTKEIPIQNTDKIEDLRERIRSNEKSLLVKAIKKVMSEFYEHGEKTEDDRTPNYQGKNCDVYDIGYNVLAMVRTDRQSAFDRYICDIPGKGDILTNVSAWWFAQTKHIIDNHYITHFNMGTKNIMFTKKCTPFKVEVVVRGFMTGSTSTSLWTHYSKGERVYCGLKFPDGLVKNQRFDNPVVTPTTKGEVDELISGEEIVNQGLMTNSEWTYVHNVALELFEYGQMVAESKGLLLVDTKYEVGKDENGKIILIDELHTCDSSRYWLKENYQERFEAGNEPQKFDKDVVREWVKSQCDPYKDEIPEIPDSLVNTTIDAYKQFFNMLVGYTKRPLMYDTGLEHAFRVYFDSYHMNTCVIFAGSESDRAWIDRIQQEMTNQGIYSNY